MVCGQGIWTRYPDHAGPDRKPEKTQEARKLATLHFVWLHRVSQRSYQVSIRDGNPIFFLSLASILCLIHRKPKITLPKPQPKLQLEL
jgi:hypothetical protein